MFSFDKYFISACCNSFVLFFQYSAFLETINIAYHQSISGESLTAVLTYLEILSLTFSNLRKLNATATVKRIVDVHLLHFGDHFTQAAILCHSSDLTTAALLKCLCKVSKLSKVTDFNHHLSSTCSQIRELINVVLCEDKALLQRFYLLACRHLLTFDDNRYSGEVLLRFSEWIISNYAATILR